MESYGITIICMLLHCIALYWTLVYVCGTSPKKSYEQFLTRSKLYIMQLAA